MRFVVVVSSRPSIRVDDDARRAEFDAFSVLPEMRQMRLDPEIPDDAPLPEPGEVAVLETWGFPGGGGSRLLRPAASDVVAARRVAPGAKITVAGAWNPEARR